MLGDLFLATYRPQFLLALGNGLHTMQPKMWDSQCSECTLEPHTATTISCNTNAVKWN